MPLINQSETHKLKETTLHFVFLIQSLVNAKQEKAIIWNLSENPQKPKSTLSLSLNQNEQPNHPYATDPNIGKQTLMIHNLIKSKQTVHNIHTKENNAD